MNRPPLNAFGPLLALWLALAVGGTLAVVPVSVPVAVGAGVLVALGTLVLSRGLDLASVFARSRAHYLLALLPVFVGTVAVVLDLTAVLDLGVPETGASAGARAGLALLVGIASTVVGGVALVSADNQSAARRRAREHERLSWTARIDEAHERRSRRAYLVVAVPAGVGGLVALGGGSSLGTGLLSGAVAMGITAFVGLDRPTEYTALDGGLVAGPSDGVRERYYPWTQFVGYERTDDALVLRRRLPGTSFHCALDDVADAEAVVAVVDDRLDRLD
ncbi:hypothetical protein [Halomarina rubra]|uniref:PH (Pleckstrin Homology) domain-containing protein n=1 Tax=Halomarina rubra TaxID=2071873 RepID=A0ABD6B0A6_9EURY|nr:hypothetical protein [Halomarina rubra]